MILKIEELIEDCKKQIKDFTDIAVIGLSGGADSTLTAILCTLALGKENVVGVEMPCSISDQKTFNKRSSKIINELKIGRCSQVNLINTLSEILSSLSISSINPKGHYIKTIGNIKARLRMISLYATCEVISNILKKKVRVIGTDNYSENFLGYFTKYGDGGVDINPIEELYKSEVYQLLDYFKDQGIITEECINRVPSAGLWEGQTDEGELDMTYDEIEKSIRFLNSESNDEQSEKDFKIRKMHQKTQHKREIPGHFKLRQYCD